MRTLNTNQNDKTKKYSRFSLPGFRSGSIIKKIIACVYYCFVFFYIIVNGISTLITVDFASTSDVWLFGLCWFLMLLAFVVPVIIVGFSDYYDIHGVKLFLIVMLTMILFIQCSSFVAGYVFERNVPDDGVSESTSEISPEIPADTIEENTKDDVKSDSDAAIQSDAD